MTALNVVSPHNLLWAYKGPLDVRHISNERIKIKQHCAMPLSEVKPSCFEGEFENP